MIRHQLHADRRLRPCLSISTHYALYQRARLIDYVFCKGNDIGAVTGSPKGNYSWSAKTGLSESGWGCTTEPSGKGTA